MTRPATADDYRHESLRFGIDLGMGVFSARSEAEGRAERRFSGTTFSWSIAVGGEVFQTCALGGTYENDRVFGLAAYDDGVGPVELEGVHMTHWLLGPHLDCYLNRTGGFHFFGALGISKLDVSTDSENSQSGDQTPNPGGIGYVVGGGYDAFVAGDLSLGWFLRLTYAPLSVDEIAGVTTKIQLLFPVLGVSFTLD